MIRLHSQKRLYPRLESLEPRDVPGFVAPVVYDASAFFNSDPLEPVIADLNGDGAPNVFIAVSSGVWQGGVIDGPACLVGELNMSQSAVDMGGAQPKGVRVADINDDGKLDLITGNYSSGGSVSVRLNNAPSGFHPPVIYPAGSGAHFLDLGDMDNDTDPDVAVSNYLDGTVSILRNNGDGTFAPKTDITIGVRPIGVKVGDLNGDGFADITVDNAGSSTVTVLKSNGDGTFQPAAHYATGKMPWGHALTDVEGDGDLDIVTANYLGDSISMLRNTGIGRFRQNLDFSAGDGSVHAAAADFNQDGAPDIVTANVNSNTVSVMLGNGNGTFQPKSDHAALSSQLGITAGDLNCDGYPDILTTSARKDKIAVLINDANWPSPPPIPPYNPPHAAQALPPDFQSQPERVMSRLFPAAVEYGAEMPTRDKSTRLSLAEQPNQRRVSQLTRSGPLLECNLSAQEWLHPRDAIVEAGMRLEGAGFLN